MANFQIFKQAGVFLVLLIFCAVHAYPQGTPAAAKPTPPSGPLIQTPPNPGQWIVTFSYPEERAKKGDDSAATQSQSNLSGEIRIITTTKLKKIAHVEIASIKGTKLDLWTNDTMLYSKPTDSKEWSLSATKDNKANQDMVSDKFSDLDWVGAGTYLGSIKYSGHDCMVFSPNAPADVNLMDSDSLKKLMDTADMLAFIDAQTRCPVEVHNNGVYRFFQFGDAPPSLVLPGDLTAQLEEGKKAILLINQRAARPY